MKFPSVAGILAATTIGFAACESDPVAPPECPPPCTPAVAYLRLDSVFISSPTTLAGGLPMLQPGNARVTVVITNVGDTASGRVGLYHSHEGGARTDTLPPLAPGATLRHEIILDYAGISPFQYNDTDRAFVLLDAPADSGTPSSYRSLQFRVAIPMLRPRLVADSLIVRAGRPSAVRLELYNASQYASSAPVHVVGCLADGLRFCQPRGWPAFGGWNVPALAPRASAVLTPSLQVPGTAAWQDEVLDYQLHLCAVPTGYGDPYLAEYDLPCGPASEPLRVRPDYEATCAPPQLPPSAPHAFTAYNCGLRPPTALVWEGMTGSETLERRFHIVAFDAQAGVTYRVTRSAGVQPLRFYDADGWLREDLDPDPERARFARGGRTYLVLYSPQGALTVSVAVLP